jgi:ribose-phosphate pyrophosphokinase
MLLISPRHDRLYKTYQGLCYDDSIQDKIVDIIYNLCNLCNEPLTYRYKILESLCPYILIEYKPSFFPDGEINVQIPFAGRNLKIIHPIVDDTSVLELCFMLDSLSRSGNRPLNLELSIPYMRYSRNVWPALTIMQIILSHAEHLRKIEFCDLHNASIEHIIPRSIKFSNLNVDELFYMLCSKQGFDVLSNKTVVVAPHVVGAKRARKFLSMVAYNTGNELDIAIVNDLCGRSDTLIGQDVNGKVCVITDDIVDSASTLCNAANILKDKGAEKVYACITHGIFSGDAVKKIEDSAIEKLFVTDSNVFDVNGSTKIEVVPLVLFEMTNPLTTLVYDLTKKWDVPLASKILFQIFEIFHTI